MKTIYKFFENVITGILIALFMIYFFGIFCIILELQHPNEFPTKKEKRWAILILILNAIMNVTFIILTLKAIILWAK